MGGSSSRDRPIPQDNVPEMIFKHVRNGNVVERYQVEKELGSGGFGKVYRVRELKSGQVYALKLLRGLGDDEERDAQKEIQALQALNHSHIIKYRTSFLLREQGVRALCIVMEFVEGMDLSRFLETRSKPPAVYFVIAMFLELLETLNYLHKKRVGHRDIKPANILLVSDQNDEKLIKLADFGLARSAKGASLAYSTVHMAGTLPYMAPEAMVEQFGKPGLKMDIWALGLVLYQALTLDSEFCSLPAGWFSAIMQEPKILRRTVPDEGLRYLLELMLNIKQDERSSAEEILQSDVIKGWRRALDVKHPAGTAIPKTRLELSAFVSLLDPDTPAHLIANSLKLLAENLGNSSFCQAFISLSGVHRLCKLLEHEYSRNYYKELHGPLSSGFALDEGGLSGGLEEAVSGLLVQLCRGSTSEFSACMQIYTSGTLPVLVQQFRRNPNSASLVTLLLYMTDVPAVGKELMENGLGYILKGMLAGSTSKLAMALFEELHSFPDFESLRLYLTQAKDSSNPQAHVRDILYNCDRGYELVNASNVNLWSEVIGQCLASSQDASVRWFATLLNLALPLREMINQEARSSRCACGVVGQSPCVKMTLYVCLRCEDSVKRCLACAVRCHPDCNKVQPLLSAGLCECGCKETSGLPYPSFPAPEQFNSFAPLAHSYHAMKDIMGFPDSLFKVPLQPGFSRLILLQDRSAPIATRQGNSTDIQFYFELKFLRGQQLCMSNMGVAGVGLASTVYGDDAFADHMLGHQNGEVAYHADDGRIFFESSGTNYGPRYYGAEVIGCGVTADRRIFFTINGLFMGFIKNKWASNLAVASFFCFGSGAEVQFEYKDFMYTSAPLDVRINRFALQAFQANQQPMADYMERISGERNAHDVIGAFTLLLKDAAAVAQKSSLRRLQAPPQLAQMIEEGVRVRPQVVEEASNSPQMRRRSFISQQREQAAVASSQPSPNVKDLHDQGSGEWSAVPVPDIPKESPVNMNMNAPANMPSGYPVNPYQMHMQGNPMLSSYMPPQSFYMQQGQGGYWHPMMQNFNQPGMQGYPPWGMFMPPGSSPGGEGKYQAQELSAQIPIPSSNNEKAEKATIGTPPQGQTPPTSPSTRKRLMVMCGVDVKSVEVAADASVGELEIAIIQAFCLSKKPNLFAGSADKKQAVTCIADLPDNCFITAQ